MPGSTSIAHALTANAAVALTFSGSHVIERFDLAYLSPVGIACIHPPIPPELGGFVNADASITVAPPAGTYQLCLRELDSPNAHAAAHPHVDFLVVGAPPAPPSHPPHPPDAPPLFDMDACFSITAEATFTGAVLESALADSPTVATLACANRPDCAVVTSSPYPGKTASEGLWYSLRSAEGDVVAVSTAADSASAFAVYTKLPTCTPPPSPPPPPPPLSPPPPTPPPPPPPRPPSPPTPPPPPPPPTPSPPPPSPRPPPPPPPPPPPNPPPPPPQLLFQTRPAYVVSFSATLSGSADAFDQDAYARNLATIIRMPVAQVRTLVTSRRRIGRRLQDKPTFWQRNTRRNLQSDDAEAFDVLAQFGTDLFADAQSAFDTLSQLLNDPTMKAQLACALGVCGQILSTSALQMLVADHVDDHEAGSGSGSGADLATVEPPSSPSPPSSPPPSTPSSSSGDDAPSNIAIPIAVVVFAAVVVVGAALYFNGACNGVFARRAPNAAGTPAADAAVAPVVDAAAAPQGGVDGLSVNRESASAAAVMATQPLLGGRTVTPGRKARYQRFKIAF